MDKICRGSRIGETYAQDAQGFCCSSSNCPAGTPRRASNVTQKPNKVDPSIPHTRSWQQARKKSPDECRSREWAQPPGSNRMVSANEPYLSPRCREGTGLFNLLVSPRSSWRRRKSGRCQEKAGDQSPRNPRPTQVIQRGRSEAFLSSRDICDTPRDMLDGGPCASHGWSLHVDAAEDRCRGRRNLSPEHTGGASRSPSPTFCVSEDWMGYSSPHGDHDADSRDKPGELTMPFSNCSSQLRRQHSGRITENSENWLRANGENAKPAPPTIANSENYNPSRGKKTNYAKEQNGVKARLRLDLSQMENQRTHRRHEFPESLQSQRQIEQLRQASPCLPLQGTTNDVSGGSQGSQACALVDAQHRTSVEMAITIMPDAAPVASGTAEALCIGQQKYMIGNELVDWQSNGRRTATFCVKHGLQGALSKQAKSMVNLRDHRNSDAVREQLTLPVATATIKQPMSVRTGASCMYSAGPLHATIVAPPLAAQLEQRVHCFGEFSSLPSTMQKDTAYLHSGLNVVKFSSRSPGVFSPNVQRVPISHALHC